MNNNSENKKPDENREPEIIAPERKNIKFSGDEKKGEEKPVVNGKNMKNPRGVQRAKRDLKRPADIPAKSQGRNINEETKRRIVVKNTDSSQAGSDETKRLSVVDEKRPETEKKVKVPAADTEANKKSEPQEVVRDRGGVLSTIVKAILYIAFVLSVSGILAYIGIISANDVFAFVKDEKTAQITISENATVAEVADLLEDNEIINYPLVFRLYIGYKYRGKNLEFEPGTYTISSTMNYDQIVYQLKVKKVREKITIVIPEGYTVDEIIELFVSKEMGTREGFIEAIQHYDYKYEFMDVLNSLELSDKRRYRLEGYLFPDTYEFFTDSSEIGIIDKMLNQFNKKFEKANYLRCEELKMTMDEIITLASIIEKESRFTDEFYVVSGVFHNRLKSKQYPKLESDATVQYCLSERKEDLTKEDLAINNPYNTYVYDGLPPGPICNPGIEAIQAAMYPTSHNYYFFVTGLDGRNIFATTNQQHEKNVAAVRAAKAAAANTTSAS